MSDKTESFQGVHSLSDLCGGDVTNGLSKPRQFMLGPAALSVSTRTAVGSRVVAHAWLLILSIKNFLSGARDQVLANLKVEGVKPADVKKVVEAITPDMIEGIYNRASNEALAQDTLRRLTAIPHVLEKYAQMHGNATTGFYNGTINKFPGVQDDIDARQARVDAARGQTVEDSEVPAGTIAKAF